MDGSHSPSDVLPNNVGWSTFSHFVCEMLNLALYLFWCVNPPHPTHTGRSLWGTVQVSRARTTAVGKFCSVCVRAGMCLLPVRHILKKIKNMCEKNQFLNSVVTFRSFHSCDTHLERKLETKTTYRWGKKMSLDVNIWPSKSRWKNLHHPCICLCEFNHYLQLNK